jgi:hypothetical protein
MRFLPPVEGRTAVRTAILAFVSVTVVTLALAGSVVWAQETTIEEPVGQPVEGLSDSLSLGFNPDGTPIIDGLSAESPTGTPPVAAPEGGDGGDTREMTEAPVVTLRGLDVLNGTVRDFDVRVGEVVEFQRLQIAALVCKYPVDDARGEAYAFLRIRDKRETSDRFSGWMLASSPAFSALDHPRYDVWVLNCKAE